MNRERALKVVLVLVGLLFSAGIYPVATILWHADESGYTDAMMLSLYFTLGIYLLLAVRNPSANRSLIGFTAWSSFAHAAVMTIQAFQRPVQRELLLGVAILVPIGVVLLILAPAKRSAELVSATVQHV
jgi:hypothetical protein